MPERLHHLITAVALTAVAAVIPRAGAEPTPTTPAPATPTSTSNATYSVDEHGYLDTAARCGTGQTLMEYGRTPRALVAICVDGDGQLEYRGFRLSDEAGLTMSATRSSDGAVIATNDNVTYSVSKDALLVSEGDTVLYRDTWSEFHTPRFPAGSATSSTSAAPSPSATSSPSATPTTSITVSTTTVTPKPSTSKADSSG